MLHQHFKLKDQTKGRVFTTLWGSLLTLDSEITIQLNEVSSCDSPKRTSPYPCTPPLFSGLVYPNNDSKKYHTEKEQKILLAAPKRAFWIELTITTTDLIFVQ